MFELVLLGIIIILIILLFIIISKLFILKSELGELKFSKQSQSVKYGQLTEQWIPFSNKFPFNPQGFRFLGKPIDGVAFEDDKIVFVEFKTNKAQLNDSQKKVKRLIEEKKVEWFELRVD